MASTEAENNDEYETENNVPSEPYHTESDNKNSEINEGLPQAESTTSSTEDVDTPAHVEEIKVK